MYQTVTKNLKVCNDQYLPVMDVMDKAVMVEFRQREVAKVGTVGYARQQAVVYLWALVKELEASGIAHVLWLEDDGSQRYDYQELVKGYIGVPW